MNILNQENEVVSILPAVPVPSLITLVAQSAN
jgi:hypothetical protein